MDGGTWVGILTMGQTMLKATRELYSHDHLCPKVKRYIEEEEET